MSHVVTPLSPRISRTCMDCTSQFTACGVTSSGVKHERIMTFAIRGNSNYCRQGGNNETFGDKVPMPESFAQEIRISPMWHVHV